MGARQSLPGDTGQLSAENTEEELEGGASAASASSPPCVLRLQLLSPLPFLWGLLGEQAVWHSRHSMDGGVRRPPVFIRALCLTSMCYSVVRFVSLNFSLPICKVGVTTTIL